MSSQAAEDANVAYQCIKAVFTSKPERLIKRYLGGVKNVYFDTYDTDGKTWPNSGTLLHAAAGSGMTWLLELLVIHYGMDVDLRRKSDRATAFHLACFNGRSEAIDLLFRLNANHLTNASGGRGAIGYVIGGRGGENKMWILSHLKQRFLDMYETEEEARAAVLMTSHVHGNRKLLTPLMLAASVGCEYAVELTVWAGEDPNYVGLAGKTALLLLASGSSFNVLPGYRDPDPRWKPKQQAKMTRVLLQHGADKDARVKKIPNRDFFEDELGMTALHLLAKQGKQHENSTLPMFKTLLQLGADPLITDAKARSAVALVHEKNLKQMMWALKNHYAQKGEEYPQKEAEKGEKIAQQLAKNADGEPVSAA